jgi:NAD-dependent dihydropyrimidine dehydrogenase PreA subunit
MDSGTIPGQRGSWYPTIEVDACISIRDCLNICEKNVFGWDAEAGHPVVERPENCELGCTACMEACPARAIRLPAPGQRSPVQKDPSEAALGDSGVA